MLYRILGNTTNSGPAVSLDGILVVSTSSLEQGLVRSASASDNTNLSSDCGGNRLLSSRRKTETSGALLVIVRDNDGEGTRPTSKGTAVSQLGLDVADNGTFRYRREGKDVANSEGGLLSAVHKLSRVHAFGADKNLIVALVVVGIAELDLGNGGTSTRVMEDFLDDTTDVSMLLGVVERTELDRTLASAAVALEDGRLTATLGLCRNRE